jgi:short subunit fatty acids transporter
MGEFFKRHQTIILRVVGVFFVAMAVVSLFWDEKSKPQKKVSVYERNSKYSAKLKDIKKSAAQERKEAMERFKEHQAKQARFFLIFLVIAGVGMVGYTFFKKE